jgi:hypothetical protein
MSGIGSLGSATNSNVQAGAKITYVARTDPLITSIFVTNDNEIKNGDTDAKRFDVCLTVTHKTMQAYVPVVTVDLIWDKKITVEVEKDFYRLPSEIPLLRNSVLDMSIATYYQDVGDARNDFELMLARTQISVHSYKTHVQNALQQSQDRLYWNRSDNTFTPKHRRNALFLLDSTDVDEDEDHHHGKWIQYAVVGDESDLSEEVINPFYKFKPTNKLNIAENNCNIWGIDITNLREHDLKLCIEILAHFIENTDNIKAFTPKSSNCSPIKPPQFRYAGIALTDACMHPQNGDTALSLNIFSALTIDNGPFDVVTNDELMWLHSVELPDFMNDGLRRRRVVLDAKTLHNIISNADDDNAEHLSINMAFNMITKLAQNEPVIQPVGNIPGRSNRRTFIIAPCKRGFTMLQRTSIMDHERRMGRSISGAKPGKRLDLINGACAHF